MGTTVSHQPPQHECRPVPNRPTQREPLSQEPSRWLTTGLRRFLLRSRQRVSTRTASWSSLRTMVNAGIFNERALLFCSTCFPFCSVSLCGQHMLRQARRNVSENTLKMNSLGHFAQHLFGMQPAHFRFCSLLCSSNTAGTPPFPLPSLCVTAKYYTHTGGSVDDGGNNLPLRGGKRTLFEGGVRVPAFLHSPLLPRSAVGGTYTNLVHVSDWLPTLTGALQVGREWTWGRFKKGLGGLPGGKETLAGIFGSGLTL